jgi:hypothetical protein
LPIALGALAEAAELGEELSVGVASRARNDGQRTPGGEDLTPEDEDLISEVESAPGLLGQGSNRMRGLKYHVGNLTP